jgi:hypothetical protein
MNNSEIPRVEQLKAPDASLGLGQDDDIDEPYIEESIDAQDILDTRQICFLTAHGFENLVEDLLRKSSWEGTLAAGQAREILESSELCDRRDYVKQASAYIEQNAEVDDLVAKTCAAGGLVLDAAEQLLVLKDAGLLDAEGEQVPEDTEISVEAIIGAIKKNLAPAKSAQ